MEAALSEILHSCNSVFPCINEECTDVEFLESGHPHPRHSLHRLDFVVAEIEDAEYRETNEFDVFDDG